MNIRTSLDEVRKIAETGKYDVLPASLEILSDFTPPNRNYEDTQERIHTLLYAGIGPGQ